MQDRRVGNHFRQAVLALVVVCVGLVLLLAVVGNFLVVDEPLEPADAIVVLAAREARAREAAALYHRGLAPRIVLARVRGRQDAQARALLGAGVPASAIGSLAPLTVNTRDELQADFDYAQAHGFRRVILVTSPYHTRRVSLVWRQISRGRVPAAVHATPERFEPNYWWASLTQLRLGLHELGGIAQVLLIGGVRG